VFGGAAPARPDPGSGSRFHRRPST
jgi:hypothetical protein